jgi:hypothetical protein
MLLEQDARHVMPGEKHGCGEANETAPNDYNRSLLR